MVDEGKQVPPPMPDWMPKSLELPELSHWGDYRLRPPTKVNWVVDKLLAAGDITVLASEGGLGKSWKAAHIAMKVVEGGMVDETFKARSGNVLWFDNENGPDENQMRCYKLDRGKGFPEMAFMSKDVYFHEKHWCADEAGLAVFRAYVSKYEPVLAVFDSLVSIFPPGTDENDAAAVRTVMDGISGVLRFGDDGKPRSCPVAALVLHHTKKQAEPERGEEPGWPTYRGSTDIKNACSFMVIMRPKEFVRKNGTKEERVQFKWVKSRRGRMEKGIYEYALADHGDEGSDDHWVEYVSFGKASTFDEYVAWELRAKFGAAMFTASEAAKNVKGFPDDARGLRRYMEKLETNGTVEIRKAGNRNSATLYALKNNFTTQEKPNENADVLEN